MSDAPQAPPFPLPALGFWRRPDTAAGLVVLAFAALAFAATYTFESVPDGLITGMGAAAFPQLISVLIAVAALALLTTSHLRDQTAPEAIHPLTVASALAMVGFMGLVALIGMIGAMFVFMVGLGRMWHGPSWTRLAAVAAVTCPLVWAVFGKLFGIRLPLGLLESLVR